MQTGSIEAHFIADGLLKGAERLGDPTFKAIFGLKGLGRRRPDLVDVTNHKFYEIGDIMGNYDIAKPAKILLYQAIFDQVLPGVWSPGEPSDYVFLPPIITGIPGGKSAIVFPPVAGVIWYKKFQPNTQSKDRRCRVWTQVEEKVKQYEPIEDAGTRTSLLESYVSTTDAIFRSEDFARGVAVGTYASVVTMAGIATLNSMMGAV